MRSKIADFIIVGGGITGLSIALNLKRLGIERVLIIERHYVGAGQSGHAAGIVRGLVGHKAVASMLIKSLNFFTSFEHLYGEKLPIHRTGFLLLSHIGQSGFLDQVLCEAKEGGCRANRISAAEALELQPGLRQDSDDIYAFERDAVYVDPMVATQALARACRRLGVEVMEGCEVHSILTNGSRILGVGTSLGRIESNAAIVCTAAWGAAQLVKLGVKVPVHPHRTEMAFFSVRPESPVRVIRIVSDASTMLYLRPEGSDQIFVGWREGDRISTVNDLVPADPDNYWQTASYTTVTDMTRRLRTTLPFMSEGFVHRTYACVYDYTPDGMPILDRAESIKGLYFALGYSGGGFSLSPWVGSVMSRFVVDGLKSSEMDLFRLSRFEEGQLIKWGHVKH